MFNLYDGYVLPSLVACACSSSMLAKYRQNLVPRAYGEVLELGIGAGENLKFYDAGKVRCVHAVEPCPTLRRKAQGAAQSQNLSVEIEEGAAEELPYADRTFDCVVCTFTLCSVGNVAKALSEARRVLKPGGSFLFCEHGLAPDESVARWQRRLDPVWRRLAGGCRLTRPVASNFRVHGFEIEDSEEGYSSGAPRFLGWIEWGSAAPSARNANVE